MFRDLSTSRGDGTDRSVPGEIRRFAQAILCRPIPQNVSAGERILAQGARWERLAQISSRHADESRGLQAAEVEARQKRESLEWAAGISAHAAMRLRRLQQATVQEGEGWIREEQFVERLLEGSWDPSKHPRAPKGRPDGGQWVSKGGGGEGTAPAAAASAPLDLASDERSQGKPGGDTSSPTAPALGTKTQLPADRRGSWLSGTKGEGVFRYNDAIENQQAGLVGKEVRFENQHIAVGGLPPEMYYGGNAATATVAISTVTGLDSDNLAADAAMRTKLGDPRWQRPEGYVWNHAGTPGSTTMELVQAAPHRRISHKGPAALPRAARRAAGSSARAARAMGALTVYLTTRDALQASGVLQPDYEVAERETYHFVAEDGSVFIVKPAGLFSSANPHRRN